MKWKSIKSHEELPRSGRSFLAIWKGRVCIAQYCTDEKKFFICFDPAEYESTWPIPDNRLNKFSHIFEIDSDFMPEGY